MIMKAYAAELRKKENGYAEAVIDVKDLKCAECKVNYREIFYSPCQHFELCNKCYSEKQEEACEKCGKLIIAT